MRGPRRYEISQRWASKSTKVLRAPRKYTSFRDVGLGARYLTALWMIPLASRRHRAGDPLVIGTVTAGKLAYAGIVSCFFAVLP